MYIEATYSTNTLLKERLARGEWPKDEKYLRAGYQTAGRGQAGNGWESEKDKNLLCSIVVESRKSKDKSPFYLNVAVSVAVCRTAQAILQRSGLTAKRSYSASGLTAQAVSIKWPNDIYWGDKKLAGILIENAIIGSALKFSIAGIGLNVNQTEWHSDAPNPVSLRQISGEEYDLDALMQRLYAEVQKAFDEDAWAYYRAHLYRREGFWPFLEREVSIEPTTNAYDNADAFLAQIKDILPTGEIVLQDQQGQARQYHFKQVRYVL